MSLEQRAATPDDITAVLEFWSVAAEDAGRPADDRDLVRRLVERDSDALRLVVDDEAIVGWVKPLI